MPCEAEGEGFEPTMRLSPHTCFQDRRLKPLGHPSVVWRVKFYHIIKFQISYWSNSGVNLAAAQVRSNSWRMRLGVPTSNR